MNATPRCHWWRAVIVPAAVGALAVAGCQSDQQTSDLFDPAPLSSAASSGPNLAAPSATVSAALAALRRATARYHDVAAAVADGFIQVTDCEQRDGETPVAAVYANLSRFDGVIELSKPEALLYEPRKNGKLTLVGVELVIPYSAWNGAAPPQFLGVPFQPEDEFGVWGLHVWVWRHNPNGVFAVHNPTVSCATDGRVRH